MKHPPAPKPGSRSANQAHTQNHGSSADGAGLSGYSLLVSTNPMQCIDEICYSLLKSIPAEEKPFSVQQKMSTCHAHPWDPPAHPQFAPALAAAHTKL